MKPGDRVIIASGLRAFEAWIDTVVETAALAPELPGIDNEEMLRMLRDGTIRTVAVVTRRVMYGPEWVPSREVLFEDSRGRWWTINGVAVTIEIVPQRRARQCRHDWTTHTSRARN